MTTRIGPIGIAALVFLNGLFCIYMVSVWLPREVHRRRPDLDPDRLAAAVLTGCAEARLQKCMDDGLADGDPQLARPGAKLFTNTQILLAPGGYAMLRFRDGSALRVSGNGSEGGFVWFTALEPEDRHTAAVARGVRLAMLAEADHEWAIHVDQSDTWNDLTVKGRALLDHQRAADRFCLRLVEGEGSADANAVRPPLPRVTLPAGQWLTVVAGSREVPRPGKEPDAEPGGKLAGGPDPSAARTL